ncbi:hypothetical protein LSH36_32g06007 [Paralvinella palmiformis]|uniref:G-protein coupled receptors family 1 profile domain-containing protein n=1 Tax=Paralvinella palmiformis TaxID=53620 RepID=A0AAD9KAE8_9ANNE|nr:hypothetical protein LSH36_32g06007 [Paralvinella palmiformis]
MANESYFTITDYYFYYDEYQIYAEDIHAHNIWIYGAPTLLALGTIGNSLSILVMLRKSLRLYTTSLYLIVLAIVDTAVLYTGLLRYWIRELSNIDIRTLSVASCKFHIFLVYFLMQFESWIIVCVTVERLAAVFNPHRSKLIFTKRFAAIQISITALVLIVIDSHFFWSYTLRGDSCDSSNEKYTYFNSTVWGWLDFVLASLAPFVLMLTANAAIIARLLLLQRKRKINQMAAVNRRNNTMTAILLTVNIVFLLTTAPIAIYLSRVDIWTARAKTEEDVARLDIVWASVNIAAYTNNAINFVLYCLSSTSFRKELVKMFHLKLSSGEVHPAEGSVVSTVPVN